MHRRILTCFVAAFGSFAVDRQASAGTLFVDANLASGANNGSSWVDAFQGPGGLQSALALAIAGDEIWVADGMYKPTATLEPTIAFDMKSGVAILGGFAGGETLASQADPETNVAILSGDLADDDWPLDVGFIIGTNSFHVVRGAGADATAILDGFTIQSGRAWAQGIDQSYGGGLLMVGASNGTVRRCTLRNNDAIFGAGGGAHIRGSQPSFTDCRFVQNTGLPSGGAIDMRGNGNAIFERCVFEWNYAESGAGVHVLGSHPRFTNCLFFDNHADHGEGGGAIRVRSSTLEIQNCTIVLNNAYEGTGGGILASASTVDVTNSIVFGNFGAAVGGQLQLPPSDIVGATVNVRYSCVGGGYAGTGNTSGPPMFVNRWSGPSTSYFRLRVGSPCIDAGDNSAVPAGGVLDLAHGPRFIDHPAASDVGSGAGPLVDMGAYETQVEPIASYCFGDTIQSPCPCSNESYGRGCSNSLGVGGALTWSGIASLTSDSVVLAASSLTGVSAHFVQGTRLSQIPFSDGFWCVNGSVSHIGVVALASGNATYLASLSVAGGVSVPGVRYYQVRYRDAVGACGPASTNSTNGVAVIWSP